MIAKAFTVSILITSSGMEFRDCKMNFKFSQTIITLFLGRWKHSGSYKKWSSEKARPLNIWTIPEVKTVVETKDQYVNATEIDTHWDHLTVQKGCDSTI